MPVAPDSEEYRETLNSMRHFSGIRFHLMTVFYVSTGGIYLAVNSFKEAGPDEIRLICCFGFVLAIVFIAFEFLIDRYITNMARFAIELNPRSHLARRSPWLLRNLVPALIMLVYAVVAVFWLAKGKLTPASVWESAQRVLLG
jgi:hypothetical protein